jgi:hypothetical protein
VSRIGRQIRKCAASTSSPELRTAMYEADNGNKGALGALTVRIERGCRSFHGNQLGRMRLTAARDDLRLARIEQRYFAIRIVCAHRAE